MTTRQQNPILDTIAHEIDHAARQLAATEAAIANAPVLDSGDLWRLFRSDKDQAWTLLAGLTDRQLVRQALAMASYLSSENTIVSAEQVLTRWQDVLTRRAAQAEPVPPTDPTIPDRATISARRGPRQWRGRRPGRTRWSGRVSWCWRATGLMRGECSRWRWRARTMTFPTPTFDAVVAAVLERLAEENTRSAELSESRPDLADDVAFFRRAVTAYTNALIEWQKGIRPVRTPSGAYVLPSRRPGERPHLVRMDGDWVCNCRAKGSMHWPIAIVVAMEIALDDIDRFDDDCGETAVETTEPPSPAALGQRLALAREQVMGRAA